MNPLEPAVLFYRNDLLGISRSGLGRLVMTNGCFDVLHPGHLHYLKAARDKGDFLLVLLNSDSSVRELKGPKRPLHGQDDRAFALSRIIDVDGIMIFDEKRVTKWLSHFRPDVWCKSAPYTLNTLDAEEVEAANKCGVSIQIIPTVVQTSTTAILSQA